MVSHRNLPERKNPLLEPTDATAGMYTLHRVISTSHLTVVRSRDSHRETSTRTDKPRCKARRQWPYQCDQAGEHGHVRLRAFEGSIAKGPDRIRHLYIEQDLGLPRILLPDGTR